MYFFISLLDVYKELSKISFGNEEKSFMKNNFLTKININVKKLCVKLWNSLVE